MYGDIRFRKLLTQPKKLQKPCKSLSFLLYAKNVFGILGKQRFSGPATCLRKHNSFITEDDEKRNIIVTVLHPYQLLKLLIQRRDVYLYLLQLVMELLDVEDINLSHPVIRIIQFHQKRTKFFQCGHLLNVKCIYSFLAENN